MDVKLDGSALRAAVTAAREAQDSGDLDLALTHWREVIRSFEDDPHGYAGAAAVLTMLHRAGEAEALLAEGIRRCPDNEVVWIDHAWIAHHAGDWQAADRRWSEVRARFPDSQPGYFGGGATLRTMRRFDEADAVYAEALSRWPEAANLLADHAANAQARGDIPEAAKRWRRLRQIHPADPESYLRAAREMVATGHLDRAEAILQEGIARLPDNPRPLVEWARIAQQRGRSAQALKRWDAVATSFPGIADGYVGAVHALNDLRRYADAQNVLLPALRMFPDSAEIATLNAWSAHYQDDLPLAIKRWEDVRARFPRHVPGYIGGIASLLAASDLEAAGRLSDEAVAAFPDNMHVAVEHARVARQGGDGAEALSRWAAVHARFPDAPPVLIGYARALAKAGELDRAEELLQAANAHAGGNDLETMRSLAEVAGQREDWPKAERRWRRIIDRFPEKALGWTGLAEMLRDAGRLDDAAALLRDALTRFPGSIDMERQLAMTATLKRDWPVALAMWDDLKRKYPRHGGVLHGVKQALYQARQDLGVAQADGGAAPFEIPPGLLSAGPVESDESALGKLFLGFESIGDTCEFGIVQRRFGAEPISLLRWASINPANLVTAFDTKLAGVGDNEHTVVAVIHGEYIWRDKRYHMFSHTFTPESAEPIARFRTQHLRRMQFLRRKLLDDLAEGDKIFVYKCLQGLSDEEARAIHAAIARYGGRQALLCVRLADAEHAPGTVQDFGGGLFMGTIDRFSTVNINVDCWVELCRKTEALWRAQKPAEAPSV